MTQRNGTGPVAAMMRTPVVPGIIGGVVHFAVLFLSGVVIASGGSGRAADVVFCLGCLLGPLTAVALCSGTRARRVVAGLVPVAIALALQIGIRSATPAIGPVKPVLVAEIVGIGALGLGLALIAVRRGR